jgi:hypothetical protein
MPYTLQRFAYLGGYDRSGIRYLWSDTRADDDFAFPLEEAEAMVSRAEAASLRARLALCTALFELIAMRFENLDPDPYPAQFLEAAWTSLADHRYAHYDERLRSEWLGPIRGPLWCGFTCLGPALHFSDDFEIEWQSALVDLIRLAYHVIPASQQLAEWLDGSMDRILEYHPAVIDSPLDDLFGHYAEWRRGPYIASTCFDLTQPYTPAHAHALMLQHLRRVQWDANPLLKSPEELAEEGLPGRPYMTLPEYESLRP